MDVENRYFARMRRVLGHIQANLDGDLSLDRLAVVAGFSPFHFHRVFKGVVGETVNGLVRRLRLERAGWLLRHTDEPLIEVALGCGYETQESFTRAFKAAFGEPPMQYKRSHAEPFLFAPTAVHYDGAGLLQFEPTMSSSTAPVRLETHPSQTCVRLRHVGPYTEVGPSFQAVCEFAGRAGLFGPQTRVGGMAHDDPSVVPADELRYDAFVTVTPAQLEGVTLAPGVERGEIPGGEYAVYTHTGPYEQLPDAYATLIGEWLPQSGREAAGGMCVEYYMNDPTTTAPEELVTLICMPLEAE